jgi:hypothetical protein
MAQAGLMTSGVYWRSWRLNMPLSGATPKSLLQLIVESSDYQAPNGDNEMVRSPGDWINGAALRAASAPYYIFGPKATPPQISQGGWLDNAPYIPGNSNANGRAWAPATQGDFTENVTGFVPWTWVCGQSASVVVTAVLVAYMKRWPLVVNR